MEQPSKGKQFVDTPKGYEGPIKIMNWNGYEVAVSASLQPYFFNAIQNRRKQNRSAIIVITGPPGEGKSYLAIRLSQILDRKFKILDIDKMPAPGKDPSQVPFERAHFLYLIGDNSPLEREQVILPDEAQYSMGSRRWYEDIQKDLMEQIESVRSQGFVIIIVALHLQLLDVIIRKFVLSYMIHVEERGKGVVYRLYTPRFEKDMRKKRLGIIRLNLPDYEKCKWPDCLRCQFSGVRKKEWQQKDKWTETDFKKCMTIRAVYERRKKHFVGKRGDEAQKKAERKAQKEKLYSHSQLTDMLKNIIDQYPAAVTYQDRGRSKGRINVASILLALEIHKEIVINTQTAYRIRTLFEQKYPDLAIKEMG